MKKILILAALVLSLLATIAYSASAQVKTFTQPYGMARDTVTNTGTAYVSLHNPGAKSQITVRVTITKVSGTVAGTITLMGSFDGTTYKALVAPNSATALATYTAADATGVYDWILADNPYNYWRVSYTGAGTMVAYLNAQALTR